MFNSRHYLKGEQSGETVYHRVVDNFPFIKKSSELIFHLLKLARTVDPDGDTLWLSDHSSRRALDKLIDQRLMKGLTPDMRDWLINVTCISQQWQDSIDDSRPQAKTSKSILPTSTLPATSYFSKCIGCSKRSSKKCSHGRCQKCCLKFSPSGCKAHQPQPSPSVSILPAPSSLDHDPSLPDLISSTTAKRSRTVSSQTISGLACSKASLLEAETPALKRHQIQPYTSSSECDPDSRQGYRSLEEIPIEPYSNELRIGRILGSKIIQANLYHLCGVHHPTRVVFIWHREMKVSVPQIVFDYYDSHLELSS